MTLEIKRLSECPLQDAVTAYNRGYEDYFYNQSKTIETFSNRFGLDGISPQHSLVAYYNQQPVGIVLGGIKRLGEETMGWNGGTGVAKDYRQKGIGKALMSGILQIYKENNVSLITLEALSKNTAAINLYKSLGYDIETNLKFYQLNESVGEDFFYESNKLFVKMTPLTELTRLDFYRHRTPWPTHCSNIHDGEALIAHDQSGSPVGYSLCKKIFHEHKLVSIGLFQLEVQPGRVDCLEIISTLLKHSFSPLGASIQRTTVNIPEENEQLLEFLKEKGFIEWEQQVWMVRRM